MFCKTLIATFKKPLFVKRLRYNNYTELKKFFSIYQYTGETSITDKKKPIIKVGENNEYRIINNFGNKHHE